MFNMGMAAPMDWIRRLWVVLTRVATYGPTSVLISDLCSVMYSCKIQRTWTYWRATNSWFIWEMRCASFRHAIIGLRDLPLLAGAPVVLGTSRLNWKDHRTDRHQRWNPRPHRGCFGFFGNHSYCLGSFRVAKAICMWEGPRFSCLSDVQVRYVSIWCLFTLFGIF